MTNARELLYSTARARLLTIPERETINRALDEPPPGLEELRAVLLTSTSVECGTDLVQIRAPSWVGQRPRPTTRVASAAFAGYWSRVTRGMGRVERAARPAGQLGLVPVAG